MNEPAMKEALVVVSSEGRALHWHVPAGRTASSIPDTRCLWDVLWAHRAELLGVAHSHPGVGRPAPSHEDVTTFAAIEASLGCRLDWWITSRDQLVVARSDGAGCYRTRDLTSEPLPDWAAELRRISYLGGNVPPL